MDSEGNEVPNSNENTKNLPNSLKEFIFHSLNYDLWVITLLTLLTTGLTLVVPENAIEALNPLLIALGVLRLILGISFVVFLPGYTITVIIWPTKGENDLTRLGIAFGISITIIPIVGLILNFTPFGLRFIPILASLVFLMLITLSIAFYRRYRTVFTKD